MNVFSGIENWFGGIGKALSADVSTAAHDITQPFVNVENSIGETAHNVTSSIGETFHNLTTSIGETAHNLVTSIGEIAHGITSAAQSFAPTLSWTIIAAIIILVIGILLVIYFK